VKKILVGLCVATVLFALIAVVLVNRWADTPHGKLDYKAAVFLKLFEATAGRKSFGEVPVEDLRAWYNSQARSAGIEVESVEDREIPGPRGPIPIRIYTSEGTGKRPVVVYYHGGGWVIGNIDTHDNVTRYLANASGGIVVSVDYKLAPENPFPAAVDDAYAALEWVAGNAESLGGDPSRIAVAGDSAGGNLSAAVSLRARDRKGPEILCQGLIYPATNLSALDTQSHKDFAEGFFLTNEALEWFRSQYVPRPEVRMDPYVSPLLAKDHSNLPPAVVITAQFDPLRDEGEAYAAKLEEAGVPVEMVRFDGMLHGFVSFVGVMDQAADALDLIAARVK
jgi:acetyl esterase